MYSNLFVHSFHTIVIIPLKAFVSLEPTQNVKSVEFCGVVLVLLVYAQNWSIITLEDENGIILEVCELGTQNRMCKIQIRSIYYTEQQKKCCIYLTR